MKDNYLNLYNNLIRLSTNKDLYIYFKKQDTFSERLTFFLLHFAFFLKNFKNQNNSSILQEINVFHGMVSDIHFWENLTKTEKLNKISNFLVDIENIEYLVDYFDDFNQNLSKKTLNSYLKSVSNA